MMPEAIRPSTSRRVMEEAIQGLLRRSRRGSRRTDYPFLTPAQLSKRRGPERSMSSLPSSAVDVLCLQENGVPQAESVSVAETLRAWCSVLALDEVRSKALFLRSEGATFREIAQELETSPQGVQRLLQSVGRELVRCWRLHPEWAPDAAAARSIIQSSPERLRKANWRPPEPPRASATDAALTAAIRTVYWAEVHRSRRVKRRHYPIYPPREKGCYGERGQATR